MKSFLTVVLLACSSLVTYSQTTLTDIERIGIRTSLPNAVIDVDGLSTQGANQILRLRSNESGSGDFGIQRFAYAGEHGETRRNHALCWGYNCAGVNFVPGDPSFGQVFESRYKTAGGRLQSEFYFATGVGAKQTRPFSIDLYHDNGSTQVAINSPFFVISDDTHQNIWLKAVSTPTSGDLYLNGNSGLHYSGNRDYFISRGGIGVLGGSPNTWKLISGGFQGETLQIFGGSTYAVAPLTIKVGNSGGFRVGGNGHRWQVSGNYTGYSDIQTAFDTATQNVPTKLVKRGPSGEIDVGSVRVNNVKVLGGRCAAIPNSAGTTADNTRAINAMLSCMRAHGLVNP
jgi:hypothetical protein